MAKAPSFKTLPNQSPNCYCQDNLILLLIVSFWRYSKFLRWSRHFMTKSVSEINHEWKSLAIMAFYLLKPWNFRRYSKHLVCLADRWAILHQWNFLHVALSQFVAYSLFSKVWSTLIEIWQHVHKLILFFLHLDTPSWESLDTNLHIFLLLTYFKTSKIQ